MPFAEIRCEHLRAAHAPTRTRQHDAPADDTRKKRRGIEHSPIPLQCHGTLQCGEESIDAEPTVGVVRGAETRNHFAVETTRAEPDLVSRDRDHQIIEWNLTVARRA